jgi:TonB-dependent SusC/RagA subfamily outer membrane receptor
MKKFFFAAILFIVLSPAVAFCQADTARFKPPVSNLTAFLTNRPAEKAHLQFDKPYYAAGDTIYFKAYVTLGEKHRLSNLSGVLHVELINTKNKADQSIKLQISGGVAWGDFALPDSLPAGNYRVLAYTNWMRNDGNYFEKVIPIGSLQGKIPESGIHTKPVNEKADLQFFPEGGQLVAGISSKVAFKAVGVNGLGTDVRGVIVDNTGVEVSRFSSAHLGMGSFYLDPVPGKTYKAKVSFADGATQTIDLPAANASGIALSVNNDSIPKAMVKIEANTAYFNENKGKDYTLLIYSGGVAATVKLTLDSATIKLDVLKRRLHTGIATVTLFSPSGEPLCERLIFVQNYDQLSLNVTSDKNTYTKREKVNIRLNVKNRADSAAMGHFSVSVTDESKVPVDENSENTIFTSLLLTSDLKGYVEQPNYYFNTITDKTQSGLDLVMLTHGYRRFEWKKLLNNEYPPIAFQPEKGLEISGQVKNLFGKPIARGTVTLVPAKGGQLLSAVSDGKGVFRFSNLVFNDTVHFVLSAVNAKGKNATKLTYFTDKPEPVTQNRLQNMQAVSDTAMSAYIVGDKQQRDDLLKYGFKGRMLKEVKIRDRRIDDQYRTQSLAGAGHADQVMHADEIEKIGGQLSTSLDGRLHGVGFIRDPTGSAFAYLRAPPGDGPMLVIVDGEQMSGNIGPKGQALPFDINQIPSSQIETIEVLKYASASIYGMDGGNGVLVITTKQGGRDPKDIASIGILPISPTGFYKAREFYSPKYENTNVNWQRDLRSTIYWKPELQTDKDGNARFDFYNADGTGNYRVVIEGIDDKGNLGRRDYKYRVE